MSKNKYPKPIFVIKLPAFFDKNDHNLFIKDIYNRLSDYHVIFCDHDDFKFEAFYSDKAITISLMMRLLKKILNIIK